MSSAIHLCSKLLSKVQPPMNAIDNKLDESEVREVSKPSNFKGVNDVGNTM